MIVRVQAAVIAVLLGAFVYVIVTQNSRVEALRGEVRWLEVNAAKMEAECESRIASMRAEGAAGVRSSPPAAKKPLVDLMSRLPVNPEKSRDDALGEMKQALAMDDSQVKETLRVLDEFHRERSRIVAEASKTEGFPFSPETVRGVDQARRHALESLKTVLTGDQYRGMVEKGYDERLGLRVAAR